MPSETDASARRSCPPSCHTTLPVQLSWDLVFLQVTPARKAFVLACGFCFRAHAHECLFTENWNCCPLLGGEDRDCMRMDNDNHSAKGAMQVASVVSSKLMCSACPSPRKAKQARPRASTKRGCRHQAAPLLHRCAAHRCTSLRRKREPGAGCAQDVCRMCGGYVRDPAAGTCIMLSTASDTTGC